MQKCVWIYDEKGRLFGSSRMKKKKKKGSISTLKLHKAVHHHHSCALTSAELLLDNFIIMPVFSGTF